MDRISIGEFARMTHLSIKQLRNYHRAGLLDPADIDDRSGYRAYADDQLDRARLIKKLRDVEMPVAMIGAALAEPDLITDYLSEAEEQLRDRAAAMAELRNELTDAPEPVVELRAAGDRPVIASRGVVGNEQIFEWCGQMFPRLAGRLAELGTWPAGPGGAEYAEPFFTEGSGDVTAWVPVAEPGSDTEILPGGRYAVATHHGAYGFDRTYAALGRYVHRHGPGLGIGSAPGPIREIYLFGPDKSNDPTAWLSEIWWPVA